MVDLCDRGCRPAYGRAAPEESRGRPDQLFRRGLGAIWFRAHKFLLTTFRNVDQHGMYGDT